MVSSTGSTAMPPFSGRASTSRSYFAFCSTFRTVRSSSRGRSAAIASAKGICCGGGSGSASMSAWPAPPPPPPGATCRSGT